MVYSIANQKGGVGKSTVTGNLSIALGMRGKTVLVIDADPQRNVSTLLLPDPDKFYANEGDQTKTLYETIVNGKPLAVMAGRYQNVSLVPAHLSMATTDMELSGKIMAHENLKRVLDQTKDRFDYVLIDCPPNLGMLTINSFMASDRLIVVVEPGKLPLEGINDLSKTIEELIWGKGKHHIDLRGFLINKGKKPNSDLPTRRAIEQLKDAFGDSVYSSYLPYRNAVINAQTEDKTIFDMAPGSDYVVALNYFINEEFEK